MKRFHLFTLFLCAFFTSVTAQKKEFFKEKKHELSLSYGSVNDENYYLNYNRGYYGGYYPSNGYYYASYNRGWDYGDDAYQRTSTYQGPTTTTGVFNGSYFYNMSNLLFSFGGTLSYIGFNANSYNRLSDTKTGDFKRHTIAFTPTVRYAWISRENFRLYSAIGWSFYRNSEHYKTSSDSDTDHSKNNSTLSGNAAMLTPLGFSFGKELFIFGQVNLGGRTGNFVGGVGYRF